MVTATKTPRQFPDRVSAGVFLSGLLAGYAGRDTVVVGLPRGGVVVAAEIAKKLGCELDVMFAGKLRAPYSPELAIGAVTEDGAVYLNRPVIRSLHVTDDYIEKEKKERLSLIKERLSRYRSVKGRVELSGKTVLIVDDGLATGATMISAIQAAHAAGAARIIVAVPGGPQDTFDVISAMKEVDKVVCPLIPEMFYAVSQLYADFDQVEDHEVMRILKEFASKTSG